MTASAIAGHPTPGPARNMLAVENGRLRAENERLRLEASARLAELRASRERIVAAGDAERCRLERNLHDGARHACQCPPRVSCERREPLPEPIALVLYFVACEALTNVAKHAQARAVSIRVSREGENVGIEIADDGVGGANPAGGTGLSGLGDRVAALDGELRCTSPAGWGTVLTATLQCASQGTDSPTPSPDNRRFGSCRVHSRPTTCRSAVRSPGL
jgi:signal transduction histidine kinase